MIRCITAAVVVACATVTQAFAAPLLPLPAGIPGITAPTPPLPVLGRLPGLSQLPGLGGLPFNLGPGGLPTLPGLDALAPLPSLPTPALPGLGQ